MQDKAGERVAPVATLAAAAEHVGRDLLPDDLQLDHGPLDIDPAAAAFLGDWYGFAASVLEELRASAGADVEPSRVQLWPEHFDLAVELGREATRARAAYGLSPGDDTHPEPYLYVAPWVAPEPDELWQATGFSGTELARVISSASQTSAELQPSMSRKPTILEPANAFEDAKPGLLHDLLGDSPVADVQPGDAQK